MKHAEYGFHLFASLSLFRYFEGALTRPINVKPFIGMQNLHAPTLAPHLTVNFSQTPSSIASNAVLERGSRGNRLRR